MDTLDLCNGIRMEFEEVLQNDIPLDAFPSKIQDIILGLEREENYSIEYTMASFLSAASTAIGNSVNICIRGGWISSPNIYMILVGRPGIGKTPPLDFAYRPIRKYDSELILKFKKEMTEYESAVENRKDNKGESELPPKPILKRTTISDFTPEAMMHALDDNKRGIVVYVDEIMGMFNSVNQYSKGQLIEQLLTAFSGKPLDISRCSMPIPIHIEHPFINIVGTMQTSRIHELIEKGYKDNGLLDRIIFVYQSSQKISEWKIEDNFNHKSFDKYSDTWNTIIRRIMDIPFNTDENDEIEISNVLHFSSEAMIYFTNWRNKSIEEINKIKNDELIDSRIMKVPMIAARIALTLQILRWACGEADKNEVDIVSTKSAIRLSEYFERCYSKINEYLLEESIDPQKKELLDCLNNVFTTKEAIQAGKEVGLSERSVMYALVILSEKNVIKKIKKGEYQKSD